MIAAGSDSSAETPVTPPADEAMPTSSEAPPALDALRVLRNLALDLSGATLRDVATRAGKSDQLVSQVMTGKRTSPAVFDALGQVLGPHIVRRLWPVVAEREARQDARRRLPDVPDDTPDAPDDTP